ncbi:MAG TPA: deoxyribodipyrimidine photo-lyase [Candidatus Omnitrophota bacterium]|nr:deoxyribodipyrimidine photo-lyase [Candidatus Omnitrophota bacterium]HRY85786.1 deoxyribodipyrimidine photo-lyase [Candidatus Omnitrophota bacterium]
MLRPPTLVWLRRNLRAKDNLILKAASGRGGPVILVYIWGNDPAVGSVSRWWLERSLQSLDRDLRALDSRLILRKGNALKALQALIKESKAGAVLWDESFEPEQRKEDAKIRAALLRKGTFCDSINDSLLFNPARIFNRQGKPFKVFTPFWNHCLSLTEPSAPFQSYGRLISPSVWPRSEKIKDLKLGPKGKWPRKLAMFWDPGSEGALAALRVFLKKKIKDYPIQHNNPAVKGTSGLSPHLHFGEISIREVWHATRKHAASDRRPGSARSSEAFLRQLVWREFSYYLLYHFPGTVSRPLRKEFSKFPWKTNRRVLRAWQKGGTGYPIVDAGMRQLWGSGWMHNRVRMIVASFLVKDLLQPWQTGAAWFMDTLADADLANNTFGWQWTAGCGADAAPYFRIFNPVLQGEKFDPEGSYVRRWVPELSGMPSRFIHKPWQAPLEVLTKAGVKLGQNYPRPIIDHDAARKRALFAYDRTGKA